MAAISVDQTVHPTLTGMTIDVLTFDQVGDAIEIINRSTTEDMWVTVMAGGPTPDDPVADAAGTEIIPPMTGMEIPVRGWANATGFKTIMKVLGDGNEYSVAVVEQGR